MKKTSTLIGKQVTIPAGTKVTRLGTTSKRSVQTTITVRAQEITRTGKTKVFWKSNGYMACAVLA